MIDQSTIEEIKNKMDIYEVVSDFVSLKRSGQNYKARSPFTNEKTPSFFVVPSKQIFKCFSTGKGGDAITFVMEMEGVGYSESLKWLANKYGIEIAEKEYTDNQQVEFNEKESLYITLNHAKEFYKNLLWEHEEGKAIGLSYFKERGFSEETIQKFDLGYTLDQWDAFLQYATKIGISEEKLEKAGLLVVNEQKKYDRFRGRVMFPIHNLSGKVIAFGARMLGNDKNQPKYINSPESEVYHKSHVLYGVFQAKQEIRLQDNCYLVEGYTDVISMHQAEVHNVVASSGTSLTEDQIKLIGRYTQNITVLYDGDNAGIKASLRGIDMILEAGLNVRAVVFPDGEDPDSFARKVGGLEFRKYLQHAAQDFISFKVGLFVTEAGNDPIKKAATIKEIVESIAKIPDGIKRTVYIKEAAELLKIDEQILLSEQNKILITKRKEQGKTPEPNQEASPIPTEAEIPLARVDSLEMQERESIRLLLNYGLNQFEEEMHLAGYLLGELKDLEFSTPLYKEILEIYKTRLEAGEIPGLDYFISLNNHTIRNFVTGLAIQRYIISTGWSERFKIYVPTEKENLNKSVLDNVLRVKQRMLKKMMLNCREKIKELAEDEYEVTNNQLAHQELKKLEAHIAKLLGNVVMPY